MASIRECGYRSRRRKREKIRTEETNSKFCWKMKKNKIQSVYTTKNTTFREHFYWDSTFRLKLKSSGSWRHSWWWLQPEPKHRISIKHFHDIIILLKYLVVPVNILLYSQMFERNIAKQLLNDVTQYNEEFKQRERLTV